MDSSEYASNEILVVDDDQAEAELTVRAIKTCNKSYKPVHLMDSEKALDYIFRKGDYTGRVNNDPLIILLDLKMSELDGSQVLHMIKSNKSTKSIPVIILTSSGEESDINRCYQLGADKYVIKPISFEKFTVVIANIISEWTGSLMIKSNLI